MTDVVMPQMGESIVEGTLTKWLKKPGDRVERDEPLFEISTDKVDTEIPSPAAGTLAEMLVEEGKTVGDQHGGGAASTRRGGSRRGRCRAASAAAAPAPAAQAPPPRRRQPLAAAASRRAAPAEEARGRSRRVRSRRWCARMAREHNIDLAA